MEITSNSVASCTAIGIVEHLETKIQVRLRVLDWEREAVSPPVLIMDSYDYYIWTKKRNDKKQIWTNSPNLLHNPWSLRRK